MVGFISGVWVVLYGLLSRFVALFVFIFIYKNQLLMLCYQFYWIANAGDARTPRVASRGWVKK